MARRARLTAQSGRRHDFGAALSAYERAGLLRRRRSISVCNAAYASGAGRFDKQRSTSSCVSGSRSAVARSCSTSAAPSAPAPASAPAASAPTPPASPTAPHPGRYEASLGAKETDEIAVMLDCHQPLQRSTLARAIEDASYDTSFR